MKRYLVYVTPDGLVPAKQDAIEGGIAQVLLMDKPVSEADKSCPAWIVVYLNKDLQKSLEDDLERGIKNQLTFCQEVFQDYKNNDAFLPVIHFSVQDLIENADNQAAIPRYAQIVDSSIWNYFLRLQVDVQTKAVTLAEPQKLQWIISAIRTNYQRQKYSLMVGREYAELHARLVAQSFLVGDHAGVSPFLFHSEWSMRQHTRQLLQQTDVRNYQWKILLLDDRADGCPEHNLREWNGEKEARSTHNKLEIVRDQLTELGFSCQTDVYTPGHRTSAPLQAGHTALLFSTNSISEAKDVLLHEHFDIILLDYKLEGDYSYRLLRDINRTADGRRNELQEQAGICGQYFFMCISAYTTAIHERLLEQGLSRNEDYWYIGQGACPTNTPEMFKFYLLKLMKKRLTAIAPQQSPLQLLSQIYGATAPRDKAQELFGRLLGMHDRYDQLRQEARHSQQHPSLLVDSVLRSIETYDDPAFWEHLQLLVYQTAYGMDRQWPEMWEELLFLKPRLERAQQQEGIEAVPLVGNYIIGLKNN